MKTCQGKLSCKRDPIATLINYVNPIRIIKHFESPKIIRGQITVQVAINLGPNCKGLECNWALVQQRETWGAKGNFLEIISCNLHASYVKEQE